MSEPFLAEIKMVGFTFAPRGWALCDGQILPINQNQSLYSLLGTTYGGDGRTTFGLPDLRGRTPLGPGADGDTTYRQGQKGGAETHVLTAAETPAHTHAVQATATAGDKNSPADNLFATVPGKLYGPPADLATMAPTVVENAGGGQSHNNMQPYLAVNFCIALRGLFPSRS